jgi:hypothetical protein
LLQDWFFPYTYLGVPLHYIKLRREDIQPIVDKIIKRVAGWKGKLLSYGGRLSLPNSCLSSIPTYLLSVIKFPKWAIEAINSQMAHFSWNNHEDKGKYHLANWQVVVKKERWVVWASLIYNILTCAFLPHGFPVII